MLKALESTVTTVVGAERFVRDLLAQAGVEVGGSRPFDLVVHDPSFYRRVLAGGELAFGESYMDGQWDCEALDVLVDRILRARLERRVPGLKTFLYAAAARLVNLQSPRRAFEVGRRHYDIGNDLYEAMLDRRMVYTCALWEDATTLDEAQERKLDLVCRKVGLRPGMRVLELGCGWGSFARFAAERYGVAVTGYTVSRAQVELGRERCAGLPVELRLEDYRRARGRFDAVVSIGIMEHVGSKNHRAYMRVVDRCLAEGGTAFVHTIGGNTSKGFISPWFHEYIFPNAVLPSLAQLSRAMEGLFVPEDVQNLGPHYDPTLMAWYRNFVEAWPSLRERYGERFFRMWSFYLSLIHI